MTAPVEAWGIAVECTEGMRDIVMFGRWGRRRHGMMIYDDYFPSLLTGFRVSEYNAYLTAFSDAAVYSEARDFQQSWGEYATRYPHLAPRVRRFRPRQRHEGRLCYTVFLNNVHRLVAVAERASAPLVFTLYPGGGFRLDDRESDDKLARVFSSPVFRRVIVTQNLTRKYLLDKSLCEAAQITEIFGVVMPAESYVGGSEQRVRYGFGKETLDVCFVAHKYTDQGRDKGYDLFVETCRRLKGRREFRFHVVGSFDATDLPVTDLDGRIRFYGPRKGEFFPAFYSSMDAIVSPNRPFVLGPGAFDGFPTGCCVEAGMAGVAVVCSDELSMNEHFIDGADLFIIPTDPDAIAERLLGLLEAPEELRRVGEKGRDRFLELFGVPTQIGKRLDVVGRYLE